MKPTKDDYNKLADTLGDALDHRDGAGLYGDNLFTAYKALRLAANMPSEKEIKEILSSHENAIVDQIGISDAARAILRRMGVEG